MKKILTSAGAESLKGGKASKVEAIELLKQYLRSYSNPPCKTEPQPVPQPQLQEVPQQVSAPPDDNLNRLAPNKTLSTEEDALKELERLLKWGRGVEVG